MKENAVRGMIEARGLVFPDDYDGACFRCGKPGALSAKATWPTTCSHDPWSMETAVI